MSHIIYLYTYIRLYLRDWMIHERKGKEEGRGRICWTEKNKMNIGGVALNKFRRKYSYKQVG